MSAQRVGSAVAADHRSVLPSVPGLPWWGAVAVALFASAVGFAFDAGSGDKELTTVFTTLYVLGCVVAVLAVRQSGVFTAVIQPPLILFCTVPGAYWLFHGAGFPGVKNILINCGYPLIERFPLMLFTAAAVLLLGMIRWYLGMMTRSAKDLAAGAGETAGRGSGVFEKVSALVSAALNRDPAHAIETASPRERRSGDRPRRATAEARAEARRTGRSTTGRSGVTRTGTRRPTRAGFDSTRSRHVRPPLDDDADPRMERPRRRRLAPESGEPMPRRRPAAGFEEEQLPRRRRPTPRSADEQMQRRRPRPPQDLDRGDLPPRPRRAPHTTVGRPAARNGWADTDQSGESFESRPRRRPASAGTNGSDSTHHPISQVRYRKAAGDDAAEPRRRTREPRNGDEADSWEYDI
ncbi:hypothetical protein KIH27_13960 [Mycobacterium sp. M1]|uniref:DUF6542 domain-containing protein n=1 Tax=Mycolicibacter acidiphilus TaxID=2835306 RepID=A0ABS5RP48_9MYCO|nr:DUF6542 domain-containing protein [Mycolicibacter acidiphilus]MBS9534694.1 hypothetical protein [Mycolicibacter acidiphilus]